MEYFKIFLLLVVLMMVCQCSKEHMRNKKVTFKRRNDGRIVKRVVKHGRRHGVPVKKVVKKVYRPRYGFNYVKPIRSVYYDPYYYRPPVVGQTPSYGTMDVPQGYKLNSSTYCALNSDCYPCNPMRSPYESEYCRGSRRKPEKCTDRDILNGRRGCYPIYSYP